MLLARGTGSQTLQSNGKMSVELIYLPRQVMMPMKDHFLFVPIQTVSFSWMKISLIYYLFRVNFIFRAALISQRIGTGYNIKAKRNLFTFCVSHKS